MFRAAPLIAGSLVILLIITIYVIIVFDPFKWGIVQAERFTWEEFGRIKEGDRVDSVVQRLGPPVQPAEDFEVLTKDPRDPCITGGCKKCVFAGAI